MGPKVKKNGVMRIITTSEEEARLISGESGRSYRMLSDRRRFETYIPKRKTISICSEGVRVTHCKNGSVLLTGPGSVLEEIAEKEGKKTWDVRTLKSKRMLLYVGKTYRLQ